MLSGGFTYQELSSFASSGTVGTVPQSQIAIDKDGALYGFSSTGGANGSGAAYEVDPGDAVPLLLASFPAASGGTSFVATGPVIDSAGDLFGVSESGGDSSQDGAVFEIVKGSGVLTQVATFDSTTTGRSPGGKLIMDASGDLFGTTANGGANGCGTAWELPHGSSTIVTLASFSPVAVNGVSQNPGANSITIDGNGNVYGTTAGNPSDGSDGTVWELANGAAAIQTLATFNGTDGMTPVSIVADTHGNLYGATEFGGDNIGATNAPQGSGTAWELPIGLGQISVLANFDTNATGEFPVGGVALDRSGNLFGTTSGGGNVSTLAAGNGTVWEVPSGKISATTLQTFAGTDGSQPRGALAIDGFGNVYGTTSAGGADQGGVLFKLDLGDASASAAAITPLVTKTTLPASIPQGGSAHGTATVQLTNPSSSVAVRGVFTINVFAAPDGTIDSTATRIGTITRSIQLARNGKRTLSITVKSLPTTAQGTETILAQVVDTAGNVSDAAAGPTTSVVPAVVTLAASFSRVTLASSLVSGGKVHSQATLKLTNSGNVSETGPVHIALELSPEAGGPPAEIASLSRRLTIRAGHSAVIAVPVKAIPAGFGGAYVLTAEVIDSHGDATTASATQQITVS